MFKIKKVINDEMDMNTYLLIKQKSMIIIDPGFNGAKVLDIIKKDELLIEAVFLTHAHYDHIRDIEMLYDYQTFPVYIHERDKDALYNADLNYSKTFNAHFVLKKEISVITITDKEIITINNEEVSVIHTPGHTFGSVMFEYKDNIFSGDTLFYDSIGRTDLFSGNFNAIRKSLNMIKTSISNQKMIFPGHGKNAHYREIKKVNRYIQ